jgi:Rrf2 family protein
MKISTKGRYALRTLLDLAVNQNEEFISLRDIAMRQEISKKYLEQIVSLLSKANLLRTSRGYQGGYMLAKEPYKYNLYEILTVTEGNLEPVDNMNYEVTEYVSPEECMEMYIWKEFYSKMKEYLQSISLQDIIDNCAQTNGNDYSI